MCRGQATETKILMVKIQCFVSIFKTIWKALGRILFTVQTNRNHWKHFLFCGIARCITSDLRSSKNDLHCPRIVKGSSSLKKYLYMWLYKRRLSHCFYMPVVSVRELLYNVNTCWNTCVFETNHGFLRIPPQNIANFMSLASKICLSE